MYPNLDMTREHVADQFPKPVSIYIRFIVTLCISRNDLSGLQRSSRKFQATPSNVMESSSGRSLGTFRNSSSRFAPHLRLRQTPWIHFVLLAPEPKTSAGVGHFVHFDRNRSLL